MHKTFKAKAIRRFEELRDKSIVTIEQLKDEGGKVGGIYCTFAPRELIRASGVLPVGLCGKDAEPIRPAEHVLPANLCPLIKSSYGYAITNMCPYFDLCDFLVGETTCDGKKKMYELLQDEKQLFLMNLPPESDDASSLEYWKKEIFRFKYFLEEQTTSEISDSAVKRQVRLHNNMRRLLRSIIGHCAENPVPISGTDMLLVMETRNYAPDLQAYVAGLCELDDELAQAKYKGLSVADERAPKILLTGCPVGKGSDKVLRLLEESGAAVVCQENCTGMKTLYSAVEEDETDPYLAIASRYLKIPCSCMTPNTGRFSLLKRFIGEFHIQGVIDLTWHCCHTYNVESHLVGRLVEERYGLPFLHIETDYSNADTGQLKVRIEAFLEMVRE